MNILWLIEEFTERGWERIIARDGLTVEPHLILFPYHNESKADMVLSFMTYYSRTSEGAEDVLFVEAYSDGNADCHETHYLIRLFPLSCSDSFRLASL